jgi:hypothetical protein
MKGSAWQNYSIMSNIDFELNKEKGELAISYSSLGKTSVLFERGSVSGDEQSFIVQTKTIDSSNELSLTEKQGLKKYVSRESPRKGYPDIIFPDVKI